MRMIKYCLTVREGRLIVVLSFSKVEFNALIFSVLSNNETGPRIACYTRLVEKNEKDANTRK